MTENNPGFGSREDWQKFWIDHSNCGGTWAYFNDPGCPRVVCSCGIQNPEREILGYQAGGHIFAPSDVQVVYQMELEHPVYQILGKTFYPDEVSIIYRDENWHE